MKVRISGPARNDLFEIWRYIARSSEQAADAVFDRIHARCMGLASFPERGALRPEIGLGIRALIVERWIALYRVSDDVEIVRIVDGARDHGRMNLE